LTSKRERTSGERKPRRAQREPKGNGKQLGESHTKQLPREVFDHTSQRIVTRSVRSKLIGRGERKKDLVERGRGSEREGVPKKKV